MEDGGEVGGDEAGGVQGGAAEEGGGVGRGWRVVVMVLGRIRGGG